MSGMASRALCAGRGSTGAPRFFSVMRRTRSLTHCCALRGSLRSQYERYWMGIPPISSGTTFAPDRTATVTVAPFRASSLPISAPELPTPTTRTRCAAKPCGRRYADECMRCPP